MKKIVTKIALATLLLSPMGALASEKAEKLMVVLTSEDSLTQFMAMILGNESQAQGAKVDLLLCGKAADIAIKGSQEVFLKPKNVSPQMLMKKMIKNGATVEVCPPYFPNAGKTKADLLEGISVAKPPMMASKILDKETKILSY